MATLMWRAQRRAEHRRRGVAPTRSEARMEHSSVDPRDVLRLEPSAEGTRVVPATAQELELVAAGYTVAEAMVRKAPPSQIEQLSIF